MLVVETAGILHYSSERMPQWLYLANIFKFSSNVILQVSVFDAKIFISKCVPQVQEFT